jgi:serine/threonine protein phosphatase PrpC
LGASLEPVIERRDVKARAGDALFLATPGLHDALSDVEIATLLGTVRPCRSPSTAARGKTAKATVVLVRRYPP